MDEKETVQPSEDLLAREFKQRLINIINNPNFSSLSVCRKEEIFGNIYMEVKMNADMKVQKDLQEYQESLNKTNQEEASE